MDGNNCMILPRLYFAKSEFPIVTFSRYEKGGSATDDGVPENYLTFTNTPQDVAPYLGLYRRQHDNSRYKIYTMANPIPSVPAQILGSVNPDLLLASVMNEYDIERDIALRDFVPYYDKLELSISNGYNTPSNIAEDITSQLHKSPNLETKVKSIPNQKQDNVKDITLSVVIPSPTFKQFKCACVSSYNETTHLSNIGNGIIGESKDADSFAMNQQYLQSYTNIGVYDPTLFDAGQNMRREGYLIRQSITEAERATTKVVINMEYTQPNLSL